jgi:hypothetical protein
MTFEVFWVVALFNVMVRYHRFGGEGWKNEAARSSETMVFTHHTTRLNNQENHELCWGMLTTIQFRIVCLAVCPLKT